MSTTKTEITSANIKVRQVTVYQWSWTEEAPDTPGTWTAQLIMDEGAEEYILRPTCDDADVLQDLFEDGEKVYFDTERKVLMFGVKTVGRLCCGENSARGRGLPMSRHLRAREASAVTSRG